MRTNVYVDGFNLYFGCLIGTPFKWLDISRLCTLYLPGHRINRIRYFTALIRPRPDDPDKRRRQLVYLRALQTTPGVSVHYGQYLTHKVTRPLVNPPRLGPRFVEVYDTNEKGSDVNLATLLLSDGFDSDYEAAAIVSNDSDLVEPIRVVRDRLGFVVGVLSPTSNPKRRVSVELRQEATFIKKIRKSVLGQCQFPDTLQDDQGTITKPSAW